MFSSPQGKDGARPMSRAAIWGALRMHGGNTNEAAATLFDWQAQSPALLKDLEDQGAKAIMHAGREVDLHTWESTGNAHVESARRQCCVVCAGEIMGGV